MPRRDDIDDIPTLMPDTDEIQAYRSDNAATGSKHRTQSQDQTTPREARIRPTAAIARTGSNTTSEPAKRGVGAWLVTLLVILLMAAGSWWMHNRLVDMEDLLTVSRGELGHARKRIGELEALVVATDVNANKSGTVVQAQVKLMDDRAKERNKFVDSEIDKLWGVSYRTNKPAIAENTKAVENNSVGIKQHTEQLAAQTKLIEKQQELVANQQKQVVEAVTSAKQVSVQIAKQDKIIADEMSANKVLLEKQSKQLASASQLMANVKTENAELKVQLAEAQQSLIDLSAKAEVVQEGLADVGVQGTTNEQAIAELKQQLATQISDAKVAATQAAEAASTGSSAADLEAVLVDIAAMQSEIATLERKLRIADALERTTSELDERLLFAEQDLDAITSFRQETNRKLNQLQEQIRTLQYSE
jgi:hypothetical protein